MGAAVWALPIGCHRLGARQLGAVPLGAGHLGTVSNLFRLESSILTRVKRATNENNVANESRETSSGAR